MREIQRIIVSALIFSKDNKILMGKKDPAKGGVYSDCWHIPGGGVDKEDTFEKALIREVEEETGIDISKYKIIALPYVGEGVSEKTLPETNEKVLAKMQFNRFEVRINDKTADEIELTLGDDLVEVRWFSMDELPNVKHIPDGKEFFQQAGYIK